MIQIELTARETLMELARSHTLNEYISMIWAQRYPHPTPASSQTGWPVKRQVKAVESLGALAMCVSE